jgi:hypothetical protein
VTSEPRRDQTDACLLLEESRGQWGDAYHFQTNDTTANDNHLLGDLLERNGTGAGNDPLLVDGQTGEGRGLGTGGDENVLGADRRLATLGKVDGNGVLVLEGAGALDVLDVVLLEEELDALGQARDGCLLGLHHGGQVELDITNLDTAALCVVQNLVVEVRVVEQRLGGDAADVEAGAAEGTALLNAGDLEAGLTSLDGSNVASNAATDDDQILVLCASVSPGGGRGTGPGVAATDRLRTRNRASVYS